MGILSHIISQAQSSLRFMVLAEGDDIRIIEAAVRASNDKIADCILIGTRELIERRALDAGLSLDKIHIEDPLRSEKSPVDNLE